VALIRADHATAAVRSKPDDDQGNVVSDAVGREQFGRQGVRLRFRVGRPVPGETVREPGQAGVDVLAAALDQTVRIQDGSGAIGECGGRLKPGGVFGAGAERGIGGLVEKLHGAISVQEGRRGCPAQL
jgi:hypothetical protein